MLLDHSKRSLVERGGVLVWSGSFVEHGGLVGKANGRLVIMAIDHFKDMLLCLSQWFPLFVSWLNMTKVSMPVTQHRSIIHHFEYHFQKDNSLLLVPISSSFLACLCWSKQLCVSQEELYIISFNSKGKGPMKMNQEIEEHVEILRVITKC